MAFREAVPKGRLATTTSASEPTLGLTRDEAVRAVTVSVSGPRVEPHAVAAGLEVDLSVFLAPPSW